MREASAPVQAELQRIAGVYGIEDDQGRETIDTTRYTRKRNGTTLATLAAALTPILLRRDSFAKRTVKSGYASKWYENTWLAGNSAGNAINLGDPKKRLLKAAFENTATKLSTPASLSLDRKQFIAKVNATILRGAQTGKTTSQIAKELDKVFGFRDAKGKLVIFPNPTTKQLESMPKFVRYDKKLKRNVFITQAGKALPIKFTTTPRIPTGGEIYNSVRTVRTELHQMQSDASIAAMQNGQDKGIDERLQKISVLDGRERPQSRMMDGQISNAEGLFQYPGISEPRPLGRSGNAAFDINDRGTPAPVILDFDDDLKELVDEADASGTFLEHQTFEGYASANNVAIDRFGEVHIWG